MKATLIGFLAVIVLALFNPDARAKDAPNCKDHPLFNRMPNYEIYSCLNVEFDAVDFPKPEIKEWSNPEDYNPVEGKVYNVSYKLKKGATVSSSVQIVRNFQNAAKAAGGAVLGDYVNPNVPRITASMQKYMVESPGGTSYDRYTILKLTKGSSEYWVNIAASESYEDYNLFVVERQAMNQDVGVNELVDKLNKDGFITLYVNFDTGKATILPESKKTLDEAANVLKAASGLKIEVAGHTDNVGNADANQKLSLERAKAVSAALVQRGIAASRLTAKGYGQTSPISDNRSEDGRAKNRRVELVKK
jgi:OOP family OmpA-OmpF porin